MQNLGLVKNLRLQGLPKLQQFKVDPTVFGARYGDIAIKDVGLKSLDLIFSIGYHVINSLLMGFLKSKA
jgi:hypothetical protein